MITICNAAAEAGASGMAEDASELYENLQGTKKSQRLSPVFLLVPMPLRCSICYITAR